MRSRFIMTARIAVLLCLLQVATADTGEPADVLTRVERVCVDVQESLAESLNDMAQIAESLFGVPLDGTSARSVIAEWQSSELSWIELMLVDSAGGIIASAPVDRSGEMADAMLRDSALWQQMVEVGEPVLGALPAEDGGGVRCHVLFPLFDMQGERKGAACLAFPAAAIFEPLKNELELAQDEAFYALLPDGRTMYTAGRQEGPEAMYVDAAGSARDRAMEQMRTEYAGRTTYEVTGQGLPAGPPQREVEWAQCLFMDMKWILLVESQSAGGTASGSVLNGRWYGAYSTRNPDGSSDVMTEEEATLGGQLNVLIELDGSHCTLTATGPDVQLRAEGVFAEHTISAADVRSTPSGRQEVWYWEGTYDPAKDAIKGTIYGNAADAAVRRSYYLRRADLAAASASDSESRP